MGLRGRSWNECGSRHAIIPAHGPRTGKIAVAYCTVPGS